MFGKKKTTIVARGPDLDEDEGAVDETPAPRRAEPKLGSAPKPTAEGKAKSGKSKGPRSLDHDDVPAESRDAAVQAVHAVALRNDYYRDQFRKAWGFIFVMAFVTGASVVLNIIQFTTREHPLPIGVTPDGRIMTVTPLALDAPVGPNGVAQWAARTLPSLYRLNFTEYRDQIAALEGNFTKPGYRGYLEAIERMQMVDLIKKNNYLVHAAPREAPQVVETGVLNGAKLWVVRAPMIVTFDNGTNPTTQNLIVTAWIVRVAETQNPLGLAIQSFSAARG